MREEFTIPEYAKDVLGIELKDTDTTATRRVAKHLIGLGYKSVRVRASTESGRVSRTVWRKGDRSAFMQKLEDAIIAEEKKLKPKK